MALKRLNAEHYIAIGELARVKSERKTAEEIAALCGVSRATIFNWKKDPLFERELKRQIVRNGQSMLPEVIDNMYRVAAETENAAMAKLVLQMNDLLTEKHEVVAGEKGTDIDFDALDDDLAAFGAGIGDGESNE